MSLSDLVPYVVQDFAFDNIADQLARTDGNQLRPRDEPIAFSARQRYTKFKVNVYQPKVRLDISNAPLTYLSATQGRPERQTTQDPAPRTAANTRLLSETFHHYDTGWHYKPVGGHTYP